MKITIIGVLLLMSLREPDELLSRLNGVTASLFTFCDSSDGIAIVIREHGSSREGFGVALC